MAARTRYPRVPLRFRLLTPIPCLSTLVDFGRVHPSAPTRMPSDTALAVHDRGCILQGPSHGLSDPALPASEAARPSRWQLASSVIMMTAPAASKWRWMSQSWMSRFQRHILHRHDQTDHAGSGCAHLACRSRTDGGTEVILRLCLQPRSRQQRLTRWARRGLPCKSG